MEAPSSVLSSSSGGCRTPHNASYAAGLQAQRGSARSQRTPPLASSPSLPSPTLASTAVENDGDGPPPAATAELQQQLHRTQCDLARARAQASTAREELAAAQQQLSAARGEGRSTTLERDDARERLRRCQENLDRTRREAAERALAIVSLTAERDDLSGKVQEAWDRVAALGRRLSDAERECAALRQGADDAEDPRLAAAAREAEELRARCARLEQARDDAARSGAAADAGRAAARSAEAIAEIVTEAAAALEQLRGANARRLLPLSDVVAAASPSQGYSAGELAAAAEALRSLERGEGAAAAPCRRLLRAARACAELFDAVHDDAVRLAAEHAALSRDLEAAAARARRAQADATHAQQALAAHQHDEAEAARQQTDEAAARERATAAACRSLAATLNCIEDWGMIHHRVQHLRQREGEWEGEARRAKQQLEAARADSAAAVRQAESQHRSEKAALQTERQRLVREAAQARDELEALRLELQFGPAGNPSTAAAAAQAAELDRLRRAHAALEAAHKEALRSIAEELEPLADDSRLRAERAEAVIGQLSRDKDQLYAVVDMLRGQLRELRGGHQQQQQQQQQQLERSGDGTAAATENGNVSRTNSSATPPAKGSTRAQAPPPPAAAPLRRHGNGNISNISSTSAPAAVSVPYPAPIPPADTANGGSANTSVAHSLRGDEEALLRSIQEDRREAAYALGRPSAPHSSSGSSGPGASQLHHLKTNRFAEEVLGVIEALDKRVTGALQRNGQHGA